jgi:hypothetical protein
MTYLIDTSNGNFDLNVPPIDLDLFLRENLISIKEGNPIAAAAVASLIYRKLFDGKNSPLNYEQLLSMTLESKDSELLVCIGEEILHGKIFASDMELAFRFFDRSDATSGFMGSYISAILVKNLHPPKSKEFLKNPIKYGHIPSVILKHYLDCIQLPFLGFFLRPFYFLLDGYRIWQALNSDNLHARFWRYRDIVNTPLSYIDERIGKDRRAPLKGLKEIP